MTLSRRKFLKTLGQVMIGSSMTAVGGFGYGTRVETEWLTIEKVQVPLKNLAAALEGFRLVQMSDFHLYPNTRLELVQRAVAKANDLKPDLVVLTGDYVQERADAIFELAPALAALNARYGVFASLGNHDIWTNVAIVCTGLKEAGLPILINQGVSLDVGGATLYLAGLDDGWVGSLDLSAALSHRPAAAPTILLAHEPDQADTFARDGRIGLQLSGHSHGGQVRLPGRGALVLPYLGQKYDQGLYQVGEMWLYTTRGVGVGSVPLRLNCPPEITEITLVRA